MTNYNNIDRVSVSLGKRTAIAGLAAVLQSCATFNEDVSAARPEAFEGAYSPTKTPQELESQVANMRKTVDEIKDVNNALENMANVATGETSAEVGAPQKNADENYNRTDLIIAGGIVIAGLIISYLPQIRAGMRFSAQEKMKRQAPAVKDPTRHV